MIKFFKKSRPITHDQISRCLIFLEKYLTDVGKIRPGSFVSICERERIIKVTTSLREWGDVTFKIAVDGPSIISMEIFEKIKLGKKDEK